MTGGFHSVDLITPSLITYIEHVGVTPTSIDYFMISEGPRPCTRVDTAPGLSALPELERPRQDLSLVLLRLECIEYIMRKKDLGLRASNWWSPGTLDQNLEQINSRRDQPIAFRAVVPNEWDHDLEDVLRFSIVGLTPQMCVIRR